MEIKKFASEMVASVREGGGVKLTKKLLLKGGIILVLLNRQCLSPMFQNSKYCKCL